jgi:hypothetical protein
MKHMEDQIKAAKLNFQNNRRFLIKQEELVLIL